MMLALAVIVTCLIGYLFGSINFAIIITRLFAKKDIRDFGSGNAGMTNVWRNVGKIPAILTITGDFLKGVVAVLIGSVLLPAIAGDNVAFFSGAYLGGIGALIGHIYPVFYKFKGGKGVATSAGVIFMLDPYAFLIVVIVFLLILVISKIVSLASIITAAFYPIATCVVRLLMHEPLFDVIGDSLLAAITGGIIIFMHRSNIKRLWNGTEPKIGHKGKNAKE